MPYLFTRLNFEVPFSGAEYLNESDVSRVISAVTPQPGFFNWLFGGSSASLTSYDGAHVMTQADATLTKNYGDNYVQLSSSTGTLKNGLQTEWGDTSIYTWCTVIQYSGAASQVLGGATDNSTGEAVQMSSAGAIVFAYKESGTGTTKAQAIPVPAGLSAGANIFIGVTRSGSNLTAFVGGASTKLALTAAKNANAALKIGPGNTSYTGASGYSKELRCYEFLYSTNAVSASDLDSIYAAAKERCSARGISVL
ncbi:hypothetical protein FML17_25670 [Klebsiella michiganensis]|uniref:hypothetical protein n=1 Tax=Klebsiella michiganensis TaxID=1134687 RepID=UPI001CCC6781|nr:hypothetical protein [Klebsiella michiganensis]MBZ7625191.1 hypothetical protein [Klebsiella michiganensis]